MSAGARPKTFVLIAVIAAVCATAVVGTMVIASRPDRRDEPTTADLLGERDVVPPFTLTDQNGNPYTIEDMKGHITVLAGTFTRCQLVCPIMHASLAKLQTQLKASPKYADVRIVTISIDPEHDTPEVLTKEAAKWKADPERWTFLTGDKQFIWNMFNKDLMLSVDDDPENELMPIAHTSKLVLVDETAHIRGYFSGTMDEGRTELLAAIDALKAE